MFPLLFGLAAGALAGISSFASSMQQGAAQRQQAEIMKANAEISRRNSLLEEAQGEREAFEQDRQKAKLRREFNELQGQNRLALGAGNVDMMSGSALDVSLGNIDAFASDMADNAYNVAMKRWEGQEKARNLRNQASVQEANATYLSKTAATLGSSLLSSAFSGGMGFLGCYSMAGGSLKGLFGFGETAAKGQGIEAIAGGKTDWKNLTSPENLKTYARYFGG